jgi:hypothetical protein
MPAIATGATIATTTGAIIATTRTNVAKEQ